MIGSGVFASPPPATPNSAATAAAQAVGARSRAWITTALDVNVEAFRSYATADYLMLWVEPAAGGSPAYWATTTRNEWAESIRSGRTKYRSVELRNTEVRVNGDIAPVRGEYTEMGARDGVEYTETGCFVETWAKRDGEWLAVSRFFP